MPGTIRCLLELVCVAGRPISHEVAAAAAEMDAAAQAKAARTLRAAFLVRTDGVRSTDTIVAYHDRIRELVSHALEDEKRQHWHARLALALERSGAAKSDPLALEESRKWADSEGVVNPERAFEVVAPGF